MNYEFKGNWEDELYLPRISSLNEDKFSNSRNYEKGQIQKIKDGFIKFKIIKHKNSTLKPFAHQLNSIRYLIDNENRIFANLFLYVKDVLYSQPEKFIGIEDVTDDWFPKLVVDKDLSKALAILSIEVFWYAPKSISWTIYNFEFSAEEEHGLSLLLEGDKVLAYGQTFCFDYSKVFNKEQMKEYWKDTVFT